MFNKRRIEKTVSINFNNNQEFRNVFNTYSNGGAIKKGLKDKFYHEIYYKFFLNQRDTYSNENSDNTILIKEWKVNLAPYKDKIVHYAVNERFLELILPILSNLKEDVVVLTSGIIPESINIPDNIFIIEFPILITGEKTNNLLEKKFPMFYNSFNTLELLIDFLNPKLIILLEGANLFIFDIFVALGKKNKIKTICIQHGWPSILHGGFKEMQYDYFFSWGNQFVNLFKQINPLPEYKVTGYPFDVPFNEETQKNSISFFFQGPYYISTDNIIEQMVDLVIFCSKSFPQLNILLREHPSYNFKSEKTTFLRNLKNVKFVHSNIMSLKEILSNSILSIAIFSSTLMESIAYGTIPFIFNPTSMPNYHPNLHEQQLGIETKTLEEAKEKIVDLLKSDSKILELRKNIKNSQSDYYKSTGDEAIQNVVNEILKISNRS